MALQQDAEAPKVRKKPGQKPKPAVYPPKPKMKPGPKPKPLSERVYKPRGPIKQVQRTYSAEKKLAVVHWMMNHKVYAPTSFNAVDGYRKPSCQEASDHWMIPKNTLHGWYSEREALMDRRGKDKKRVSKKKKAEAAAAETDATGAAAATAIGEVPTAATGSVTEAATVGAVAQGAMGEEDEEDVDAEAEDIEGEFSEAGAV